MSYELPENIRRSVAEVATHEMGHYVMARVLKFRTGGVKLEVLGPTGVKGGAVIFPFQPVHSLEEARLYIERRVQVLYAGAQAQALSNNVPPNAEVDQALACTHLETTATDDYSKVRELVRLIAGINYAGEVEENACNARLAEIEGAVWAKAVALVEAHADTIHALASNLVNRVKRPWCEVEISAAELEALPGVQKLSRN